MAHVALLEPEIPQNTGSIGRSCVAVGAALHLIHPLGFDIDEKACRRAGLDYWPRLVLREHASFGAYLEAARPPRLWMFTARGGVPMFDAEIEPGDHLLFGRESVGLPDAVLEHPLARRVAIPMVRGERSLNLSNAVSIVLYEIVRRAVASGRIVLDASARWGG